MVKKCVKCKKFKDLSKYGKYAAGKDGLNSTCKPCRADIQRQYSAKNEVKEKNRKRKWARENPEKTNKWNRNNPEHIKQWKADRDYNRKYRLQNLEREKERLRKYSKTHSGEKNALNRKRYISKIRATPPWLTREHLENIKQIYIKAKNSGMHVDHIVPLKGKNVSGLHVPWNLQIISASDNIKKGNRFQE